MQKLVITIILFPAFTGLIYCQNTYHPYTPTAAGGCAGGNFTNALNAAFNPSLIPFVGHLNGACYAEKRYLTDLNVFLITVSAPFENDGVSLTVQRYGNALFQENTFAIGYGKKIGAVNIGVVIQNIRVKVQDAEVVSLIKAGIASSIKLSDDFFVSCRISNPDLFAESGSKKVHCASSYSLIFGFEASTEVGTSIEMLKDERQPISIMFSLQYRLSDQFICTLNWNTYTNQPFASVGWQQKLLTIQTGCSYHPVLGVSPSVSIIYNKHGKK